MKLILCLITLLAISMAVNVTNDAWRTSFGTCTKACIDEFTTAWAAVAVTNGSGEFADQDTKDAQRDIVAAKFFAYDGTTLFQSWVNTPVVNTSSKDKVAVVAELINADCKYVSTIPAANYQEYQTAWASCYSSSGLDSVEDNFGTARVYIISVDAVTPVAGAQDISLKACLNYCQAGKFGWKTDIVTITQAQEWLTQVVAYEVMTECNSDCENKNTALETNYNQLVAGFWMTKVTSCLTTYALSGSLEFSYALLNGDEGLDAEEMALENSNACQIYRGTNGFSATDNYSAEQFQSFLSCRNFCMEWTQVGTEGRTNTLLDTISTCKDTCLLTYQTAVAFILVPETDFAMESGASILSISLALLALSAFLL